MGLDNLVVAGSHGFDIWSPDEGKIEIEGGEDFEGLIEDVKVRVDEELGDVEGASVEPKKASVAVHYRLASEEGQRKIKENGG